MSVLVWMELDDDFQVPASTAKTLGFAAGVAQDEGTRLQAAVIGSVGHHVEEVAREQGVAVVHAVEHDLLADYAPEAWGEALTQLLTSLGSRVLVAAATARGNEVLAHVAARADQPMAANCVELRRADGAWELTRQRWGGVLLEDARLEAGIALLTVLPHGVEPAATTAVESLEVRTFAPELKEELTVARVRQRVTRSSGVSLATAPVVVAGGRGVGSAEGFMVLEELAELLDGAVGCSRVATNNGWRSHNDQVGQTGTRVAPDLYIALGISGATQHWVGCANAKTILAVNTDPQAPMVTRAHYAVVGDLHTFLPALIEEVRARKAGG